MQQILLSWAVATSGNQISNFPWRYYALLHSGALASTPNSSSVIVSNSENTSRNTNTTKILATTYFSPLVVVSNYINARFDEKLFLHQGRRFSSKIYILMLYRLLKPLKGKARYYLNYCWNISSYFVFFFRSNNQEMVKSPSIAIICWPRSFLKFLENSWRARSCIYRLIECNWALKLIAALTILSIYQFFLCLDLYCFCCWICFLVTKFCALNI